MPNSEASNPLPSCSLTTTLKIPLYFEPLQHDAVAYNNRGSAYRKNDQIKEAIADYTEAIRLKPDFVDAYNNRGLAWLQLGECEKAKLDLSKARFMGGDIVAAFQKIHGSIADFEQEYNISLQKDIATMLTQQ